MILRASLNSFEQFAIAGLSARLSAAAFCAKARSCSLAHPDQKKRNESLLLNQKHNMSPKISLRSRKRLGNMQSAGIDKTQIFTNHKAN
jgi:hypothetical protein